MPDYRTIHILRHDVRQKITIDPFADGEDMVFTDPLCFDECPCAPDPELRIALSNCPGYSVCGYHGCCMMITSTAGDRTRDVQQPPLCGTELLTNEYTTLVSAVRLDALAEGRQQPTVQILWDQAGPPSFPVEFFLAPDEIQLDPQNEADAAFVNARFGYFENARHLYRLRRNMREHAAMAKRDMDEAEANIRLASVPHPLVSEKLMHANTNLSAMRELETEALWRLTEMIRQEMMILGYLSQFRPFDAVAHPIFSVSAHFQDHVDMTGAFAADYHSPLYTRILDRLNALWDEAADYDEDEE